MASSAGRVDRRVLEDVAIRVGARVGTVRYPYRVVASATGYAITAWVAWFLLFDYPGWAGRDLDVWLRVGADVRSGVSPYAPGQWHEAFYYAPPWALLFGATSWVGKPLLWALITVSEIAALRYIAGSWLRVGYFGVFFLTGAELVSGAFNLVIAAALAAAVRGDSRLAALAALAKLSPVLAIREWRGAAVALAVAAVVTLPVIGWWADWIAFLATAWTANVTLGFGPPLLARLGVAVTILVLWSSPKAGAAAAAIAIPGLYAISAVLLFALFIPPKAESKERSVGVRWSWPRQLNGFAAGWRAPAWQEH